MDSQYISKMYGPPQQANHPHRTLKLIQAIDAWFWNEKENSPAKPELHIFWKQVWTEVWPNRSDNKSGKVLQFQAEEPITLALPHARAQLLNREVHHSWPFFETQERQKANSTGQSVLSWQHTLPLLWRCWHVCQGLSKIQFASAKAKHPSLIRTSPCLPAWTQKKTEAVLKTLHKPEDALKSSCKIYSHTSTLSNPQSLTLFLKSDHPSGYGLESLMDSGSSNSFIDLCLFMFVQTQHLQHMDSSYQTPTHWEPPIHHLAGTRLANLFPLGNPIIWLLTSLCSGPEFYIVLGIPLAHPHTIPWLTGYWQHLFLATITAWIPRAHPLSRHFHCQHPFELPDSVPDILNLFC